MAEPAPEEVDRSRMVGLVLAGNVSQAICTAVELGLPEALADGPRRVDDLAKQCQANPRQLARLMRVLAAHEVFARAGSAYELTPLGRALLVDAEDGRSVAGMALFAGSGWLAAARAALTQSVRTGASAFRCAHGKDLPEAMQEHPDLARLWEGWSGYSSGADALAGLVVESYNFSSARHVIDLGGRYGSLLAEILLSVPEMTGTVFDLPGAEDGARAHLRARGVEDRARVASGSFFDGVPEGGDLYVLSNVLLDWDDERALELLGNCRDVMGSEARLLVIEPMFGERVLEGRGPSLFDLWMMVHSGGMRTVEEVRDLLDSAGLDVREVLRTSASAATLIEAERR